MYAVSQAYINKLKAVDIKRRRIRGSVDNIPFTENDILAASFKYSDIAVNSSDIKLGGVFISTLQLTFLDSFASRIARGTWRGRTITATIGLQIDHQNDTWEDVPIKPYTIDEANHTALGVDIIAYDAMARFDAPITMNATSGNLYGFATLACQACGVDLGMTAEEMADLPNGGETLGLYPENDISTWRDFVSWIAVTAGGFATINRNGALEFRTWKTEPALTIGINDRFTGGSWSDFSTNYTAISIKNIEAGTTNYYAIDEDTGLTLDVGANPLLQYGTAETLTQQRRAVLMSIRRLQYIPFKSASLIDPAIDLGDVIQYTEGLAAGSRCCVMRIDFSFNAGATLQGYGRNPAQANAKSRTDKELEAQAANSKAQGLTYYTFINTTAISLTTTPQRLLKIAFVTSETTTVTLWHEFKIFSQLTGSTQTITLEYYFDDNKLDYEPVHTYGEDGEHILGTQYWLQEIAGGEIHYWEVRAYLDEGSATIGIGDIHALLQGQKLAAQVAFDGNIECTDTLPPYVIGIDAPELTDTMDGLRLTAPDPYIRVAETITPIPIGIGATNMADALALNAQAVQYELVTEDDEDNILTEEGGKLLTEA